MSADRLVRLALCAALLATASAPALAAQSAPQTALVPDTVTVGDVFLAAIRVRVAAGESVAFPDALEAGEAVDAAGRREIRVDSAEGGERILTAVYPLAAWRPGVVELGAARVGYATEAGVTTVDVRFPAAVVRSVLPADTAGIAPMPAKDVLGGERVWWPLLLMLLAGLAVAALCLWWWRRRRSAAAMALVPRVPPRQAALSALDRARAAGLVEAGRLKEFYSLVTNAVRHYVAALHGGWGEDLTTPELAARMTGHDCDDEAAALSALLQRADLVKFARQHVTSGQVIADWEAARAFVARFDGPALAVAGVANGREEALAA
jgi:hypothetical protein